ncbi:MAG: flagellar motor protein MotB [Spirochaetia bacterium]|jgi:chemotaxis protein MotB|nr:flagellar motor protein MotB [Spirochaetia bacterium]
MAVKKKKKQEGGAPAWMVSWSDMTTLLLTFFITMMSFAEIDGKDFYLVLSSFQGALGILQGGSSFSKGRLEEMGMTINSLPSATEGRSMAKSIKDAVSLFQPEITAKKVRVEEDERGLIISLSGDAFFDPGSAVIKTEVRDILDKAGKILNAVPNFVRIEGHASSTPIGLSRTRGYSSNWELAAARSVNVLRYLEEENKVVGKKMSSVSFGEHRPLDINDTPEGRAFNQRVDIVILRDKELPKGGGAIKRPIPDEEWR